jgi:hypothetical protein
MNGVHRREVAVGVFLTRSAATLGSGTTGASRHRSG